MCGTQIQQLQAEIARLEVLLNEKKHDLTRLQEESKAAQTVPVVKPATSTYTMSVKDKITLFHCLFRGREDVYAKRYESKKSGQSGYLPACQNEWVQVVCEKAKTNTKKKNVCATCPGRIFIPVSDDVIQYHLSGCRPKYNYTIPFVMGVYPLLRDETCWFLALDFDKQTWRQDAQTFIETCRAENIPASLERSRSGNGAHIWLFFEQPVAAAKARTFGSVLMTKTLDRRPEIGLDSFDRFFPNQDTLPKGGFGNLIALPLQKAARAQHNTEFLDESLTPNSAYFRESIPIFPNNFRILSGISPRCQTPLILNWQTALASSIISFGDSTIKNQPVCLPFSYQPEGKSVIDAFFQKFRFPQALK
jgi:hypothetical protein